MKKVHVAAAIIVRDGRVLAGRRADKGDGPSWEFPGGKIEDGETPEQACRREVSEELGCDLQLVCEYDTVEHDYGDFHLTMEALMCTLAPEAEPRALEHAELRWLARRELSSVEWLGADARLAASVGVYWDQFFLAEHL